ncbi:hypothetical protein CTI12_AA219800 [Artemisia annua]|uniref:Uncharacterized protein n=1 Tax=Artemisia annua TaxID=35608 RepID=A0A2U1NVW2_ARTAN|nr:hypothetical protein CTI12_AA219800 [Artemisia annua]
MPTIKPTIKILGHPWGITTTVLGHRLFSKVRVLRVEIASTWGFSWWCCYTLLLWSVCNPFHAFFWVIAFCDSLFGGFKCEGRGCGRFVPFHAFNQGNPYDLGVKFRLLVL